MPDEKKPFGRPVGKLNKNFAHIEPLVPSNPSNSLPEITLDDLDRPINIQARARIFATNATRLNSLAGLNAIGVNSKGASLFELINLYASYTASKALSAPRTNSEGLTDKERQEKAKADILEMKRDTELGNLLSRKDIEGSVYTILRELRANLEEMPKVLPNELAGRTVREIGSIIKVRIEALLNETANKMAELYKVETETASQTPLSSEPPINDPAC